MKKFFFLILTPLVCHASWCITGDLLYWQAQENGLAVGINDKGKVKSPSFEWDPGYRVGFGTSLPHDDWQIPDSSSCFGVKVLFTHLHTKAFCSTEKPLFPLWGSAALSQETEARWRLHLGLLDLDLNKNFSFTYAFFKPLLGIRAAWIRQKYKLHYFLPDEEEVSMKNKFFGVGPQMGTYAIWKWSSRWGITGKGIFSLLWGELYVHQDDYNIEKNLSLLQVHAMESAMLSIFEYSLGFIYQTNYLDLSFLWEQLLFFGQNQLLHFTQNHSFFRNQGDLSIQGITIHFKYTF